MIEVMLSVLVELCNACAEVRPYEVLETLEFGLYDYERKGGCGGGVCGAVFDKLDLCSSK